MPCICSDWCNDGLQAIRNEHSIPLEVKQETDVDAIDFNMRGGPSKKASCFPIWRE